MKIKDLRPNAKNPRRMSTDKRTSLYKSLEKFGDLSGIVFNETTQKLVGGHQRSSVLGLAKITIVNKYETPTKTVTIADGFAEIDGEKFSYRIVAWDEKKETEALLAANKHGGSWDHDLLRVLVVDVPNLDMELAGFDQDDIKNFDLNISLDMPNISLDSINTESSTKNTDLENGDEESDEDYIKNHVGPEDEVRKEIIGEGLYTKPRAESPNPEAVKDIDPNEEKNPFDEVNENTEPMGRKIVIIVSCPSDDIKKDLKEKIRPIIEEAGAKLF